MSPERLVESGENKFSLPKERRERENPFFKVAIFDLDGTLFDIGKNKGTWHLLFKRAGLQKEYSSLREKYKNKGREGHPDYMKWTEEAFRILKTQGHLMKEQYLKIIETQPYMEGARETIAMLKKQSFKTIVVTGGVSDLSERAQKDFGIDFVISHCTPKFGEDSMLDGCERRACDFDGKLDAVLPIVKGFGFELSQCVYVGNGINDVPIMNAIRGAGGLSIAFNPVGPEVKGAASMSLGGTNLFPVVFGCIAYETRKRIELRRKK